MNNSGATWWMVGALIVALGACDIFLPGDTRPDIPGKLVFATRKEGERRNIYTMNADGSKLRRITDAKFGASGPSWFNNGKSIVYVTEDFGVSGASALWQIDANGKNNRPVLENGISGGGLWGSLPVFSPDGNMLAYVVCIFCQGFRDNEHIFLYDALRDTTFSVSENFHNDTFPKWSPDGSKIAFVSSRTGTGEIFLMNRDGTNHTLLADNQNPAIPVWNHNGTRLLYSNSVNQSLRILRIFDLETKSTQDIDDINLQDFEGNSVWPEGWADNETKVLLRGRDNTTRREILFVYDIVEKKSYKLPFDFENTLGGIDWYVDE